VSKKKRLLQRLLNKPKDLRYAELARILEDCGFVLDHSTGSHAIFTKPGHRSLTIPQKTPVKSYLIDQVLAAIEDCIDELLKDTLTGLESEK
jgi:predicted RNA binding protein YcfA (HicA-like mRNA interferase family)